MSSQFGSPNMLYSSDSLIDRSLRASSVALATSSGFFGSASDSSMQVLTSEEIRHLNPCDPLTVSLTSGRISTTLALSTYLELISYIFIETLDTIPTCARRMELTLDSATESLSSDAVSPDSLPSTSSAINSPIENNGMGTISKSSA